MGKCKVMLPKCILARIDKFWYPTIPTNYPKTTSAEFDFPKGDDKVATITMEENLGTENSIISAEDVPEREAVGAYIGTYDVTAEAGERALVSPNKLPKNAVGALAYHYNADEDTWNLIDTVEVEDGYVYATLEEFSPIAVFALTRAAYYDTTKEHLPYNVFVCNGIATKVYKNEEDKIIAKAGDFEQELTEDDSIVGGSYDGTPIESTSIYLENIKLQYVVAGSWVTGKDLKNHTKTAKLVAKNCEFRIVTGAGIWNCIDDLDIELIDCKVNSGVGNQMSFHNNRYSNKTMEDSDKGLASNQYVKKSNIVVKNCTIDTLYSGGNNGYSTTLDANLVAENCKCTYACNGQSNGTIYNTKSIFTNCQIEYLNNNNRGHYGDGNITLNGGNIIKHGFLFADIADMGKETADIRGKIAYDFNAGDKFEDLCVGAVGQAEITTADEAAKYIKILKVSRDADITYTRNANIILKDIIRIK